MLRNQGTEDAMSAGRNESGPCADGNHAIAPPPVEACRDAAHRAKLARNAAYKAEASALKAASRAGEHALTAAAATLDAQRLAKAAAEAEARAQACARLARWYVQELGGMPTPGLAEAEPDRCVQGA